MLIMLTLRMVYTTCRQEYIIGREGEYLTPLSYSVTAVRQVYDLYNDIHMSGI